MRRRDCPTTDALAGLLAGPIEPSERERLLDHVVACDDCAEELRAVAPIRDLLAPDAGRERRRAITATPLLRVAATVVVVGGLGLLWWRIQPPAAEPVVRGGSSETIATVPPDDAILDAAPATLAIRPHGEGAVYRFELYDDELELVWESPPVREPSVAVPGPIRQQLEPGRVYSWRVVVETNGIATALPFVELEIADR